MSYRFRKLIPFILLTILGFLLGIYNKEVSVYFLRTEALIGLLICSIIWLGIWIAYLYHKISEKRINMSYEINEKDRYKYDYENLKRELYNLKTKKRKK